MKKAAPNRCVVDTNVPVTANGAHHGATRKCVDASARALQSIMSSGRLFVDHDGWIVREYRDNLSAKGQPGPGDAFLKWVLTHEWAGERVIRVRLPPPSGAAANQFDILSADDGVVYDPSDCKFLAVSAVHPEHPPILQATDSKWWGWRASLAALGVSIHFLCPEFEQKYKDKIGR